MYKRQAFRHQPALPSVRAALTQQQQQLGEQGGLVAEGRDIGTAVFPDAELKIYLTATVAERARRRAADLTSRGLPVPALSQLEQEIADRDHKDSTREVAPLRQANDAVSYSVMASASMKWWRRSWRCSASGCRWRPSTQTLK